MTTIAGFRAAFPEFSNVANFADPEVQFWLDLSGKLIDQNRWGSAFDFGQQLFMAHNLSIGFTNQIAVSSGQQPGQVSGAITSASVDKVSYSRDAGSAMEPKNGHWNLTNYGLRFVQLMRMMGAGPIHVGGGETVSVSAAWSGPG